MDAISAFPRYYAVTEVAAWTAIFLQDGSFTYAQHAVKLFFLTEGFCGYQSSEFVFRISYRIVGKLWNIYRYIYGETKAESRHDESGVVDWNLRLHV